MKKLIIPIIIFLIILFLILTNQNIYIDYIISNYMTKIKTQELTYIFKFISKLADAKILLILCFMLFIAIKNKKISLCIISNLAIVSLLNQIVKILVKRSRPLYGLIEETGYSFPSGHAMISFAFYGLLIYFICKYLNNKSIKTISCIILSVIILLIGISRVYLSVHYTTDIIGGYLLSYIYLTIFINLIEKYINKE